MAASLTTNVDRCLLQNERGELLLLRRSTHNASRIGLWEVPGGKEDETDEHEAENNGDDQVTVRREVAEETGIVLTSHLFRVAGAVDVTSEEARSRGETYTMRVYLGQVASATVVILSDEHDAFRWESRERALGYPLTDETEKALHVLAA